MLETNLNFSTSERPENGQCRQCGKTLEPFFRPEFLGLSPKWIPPSAICLSCEQEQEAKQKVLNEQKRLDEAFRNSRMSLRFKARTFQNFVPERDTQKAYEAALSFQSKNTGLLFSGDCGVGKTHLAAAIANREIGKTPTLFISCPELLLELREEISGRKKDQPFHLFDLTRRVQLLVLDDIGAEKSSEWVQETLFVLINYRYEQMLPTIFTTNCTMKELQEKIGKRTTSRIVEMCHCVRMKGEDARMKRRVPYGKNYA